MSKGKSICNHLGKGELGLLPKDERVKIVKKNTADRKKANAKKEE